MGDENIQARVLFLDYGFSSVWLFMQFISKAEGNKKRRKYRGKEKARRGDKQGNQRKIWQRKHFY